LGQPFLKLLKTNNMKIGQEFDYRCLFGQYDLKNSLGVLLTTQAEEIMTSNESKSKDELLKELNRFRQKAAKADELHRCLQDIQHAYDNLKENYQVVTEECAKQCARRDKTEEALRMAQMIVDRSPVVLYRRKAGEQLSLEYVSENIRQFGYTAEEFLTLRLHFKDIVHPDDMEKLREEIRKYANADVEEYIQVYRCLTKNGDIRWVEDQTSVVKNKDGIKTHYQGILVDITERKLAREALHKSEEKYRRIVETAAEGFLLMDQDLKIVDVNDAYCKLLGYRREELIGKTPYDLATYEFRQYLQSNKERILAKEYRKFEGSCSAKDGHDVPILVHGNTLRDDRNNVIGNMAFITDMTEHKKALMLASEVQKSLLPQDKPQIPGLDISGRNISCDEIGGDYFDFLGCRDSKQGSFGVVVGDISGHGVDSALLMTTARAFLRMRASQPGTISEIITAMNRHLYRDVFNTGRFMTLFYLTIDRKNRCLYWVRAGHDPALIYDPAQDDFEELKGSGVALGVNDKSNYKENRKTGLSEGHIISVGTDGIWEATNGAGEMFGKERLRDIIRKNAAADAGTILNAVYDELHQFTIGQKIQDDITLVIIKVNVL
jgi:sigma-B regulation protein RsbU (phosphoserine phosphatase)